MSKKAANNEAPVRVLKKGTCPNLSGKSTLTYQVGCTDAGEIMLRITGNTNPGYFNTEWVSYAEVQDLLSLQDQGKGITSYVLTPLYRGKSTNSPSFLFAALKQEGLVKLSEFKKRCYDRCSDTAFLANIGKLIDGKAVPASSNGKAGKNNKAAVVQEPAASEPATEPGDVPDSKPAKRGRPKKTAAMVDAVVPEVAPAEGA